MFSFDNNKSSSQSESSGMSLDRLITCKEGITTFYRGLSDAGKIDILFELPMVIGGQFGTVFPQSLTFQDIIIHKTTSALNSDGGKHLVGMSVAQEVAENFGHSSYFLIDPALFRDYIVDLDACYKYHQYTYPGRMLTEREYVTPMLLSCSIQSIIINGTHIKNPFYISIDSNNHEAKQTFNILYNQYIVFLRKKYAGALNETEEAAFSTQFIQSYISFYEVYAKETNPFEMTIEKLKILYPDFMTKFSNNHTNQSLLSLFNAPSEAGLFQVMPTLKDLTLKLASSLFKHHAYLKNIQPSREVMTVYDDPYAYGANYD